MSKKYALQENNTIIKYTHLIRKYKIATVEYYVKKLCHDNSEKNDT